MAFGAGRPAASPEIYEVAQLTEKDIAGYQPSRENPIKKLKDSHHRIAHCFALGLRPGEIAEITGYSLARISTLRNSPAMDELVAKYRNDIVMPERQGEYDHHFTQIVRARNLAIGEIIDRLEDDEAREKFSNAQLLAITSDGSDRTGYPKRSVAVNINSDFASRLDKAIDRANKAKVIEGEVLPPAAPPNTTTTTDGGGGTAPASGSSSPSLVPVPFRRRA